MSARGEKAIEWDGVRPDHRGMSQTAWNRLRDRLELQTWTKGDVERLQERVRRVKRGGK